jgi:transcription initiation factor TFIID subunit 5
MFVYSLLNCAAEYYIKDCENFYKAHKGMFEPDHADDLRALAQIRLPEHLNESQIAKLYRSNKYRVWLTEMAFNSLVQQMELRKDEGGAIIIHLLTTSMDVRTYDRAKAGLERSIQMIRLRGTADDDLMMEDEGIPGFGPGRPGPKVIPDMDGDKMPRLNLDPMPMDQDLQDDVRAQLQEKDDKNPPKPGQSSLVEEFERRIKREPTDDGIGVPSRDIPLPPSLARDVAMEVTKVIEHRDRFKLPGRTGGIGPGVSVTMFTFHNTFGR